MKIAILTQPLRYNYGGILQNYALQTVLQRMGHEVITLDPRRYYYGWWQHLRYSLFLSWSDYRSRHMNGEPLDKRHFILFIINYFLRHSLFRKMNVEIFEKKKIDKVTRVLGKNTFTFVNKHIKRKEYSNLSEEIAPDTFDAFVVGSDQVWRPEYNANLLDMFLEFTKGWDVRRIAYSASFGVDFWNCEVTLTERCKQSLKQFDHVSVRESSGVKLCKEVFGENAIHLLDPTLLLTKEDYFSLLQLSRIPKSNGNLLVYFLDYTDDKKNLIQQITDEYQLVPFRVNSDVENYLLADIERRIQPPVEQWLRGFYDAEYVITDSFHACVFSIIFDKPFIVYTNEMRGNTRFESLLNQFSLADCMISSSEEFHGFIPCKKNTSQMLNKLREKSICLLWSMLQ